MCVKWGFVFVAFLVMVLDSILRNCDILMFCLLLCVRYISDATHMLGSHYEWIINMFVKCDKIFARRRHTRGAREREIITHSKRNWILTTMPQVNVMPRPQYVFGTISPYPTQRNVIAVSQKAFRMLANSSSWLLLMFVFVCLFVLFIQFFNVHFNCFFIFRVKTKSRAIFQTVFFMFMYFFGQFLNWIVVRFKIVFFFIFFVKDIKIQQHLVDGVCMYKVFVLVTTSKIRKRHLVQFIVKRCIFLIFFSSFFFCSLFRVFVFVVYRRIKQ